MLQIGDQLDRYQIQAHMAQGGMSDIYRAYDLVGRREVVIKIPDPSMLGDPAQFERFQRELEVLNTLDHPAVLKGLGSGKHNRIPYLVTEYVDGQSLRALLEVSATLTPAQAAELAQKIADGMAYCHQNNVIHRDLKPENILVSREGQPVIMDFGLALTKSSHRVTYSNLSATMGTPDYMAPEQIDGQRGDQRTDIYALGIILYEMLAGHPPFRGDSNLAILSQHKNALPPRLDKINPAVPPQLAAVVARCLAKKPEERYPDMESLAKALKNPAAADVRILEKAEAPKPLPGMPFELTQVLRAVAIAIGAIAVLMIVALILQTLR